MTRRVPRALELPLAEAPQSVLDIATRHSEAQARGGDSLDQMWRKLKRAERKAKAERAIQQFFLALTVRGVPLPEREVAFAAPEREWRFDLAWPDVRLALEIDGGAFAGGRHTRGAGFREDQFKRNAAVLKGWRVLHVLPEHVDRAATAALIQSARRVIETGQASPLPEECRKCGKPRRKAGR